MIRKLPFITNPRRPLNSCPSVISENTCAAYFQIFIGGIYGTIITTRAINVEVQNLRQLADSQRNASIDPNTTIDVQG